MPGTGRTAGSPTRARLCENEAGHVRARLDRRRHVFLARQAAHLHERTREELRELRARVRGAHERGADEDRVRSRQLGSGALGARLDAALGDHDPISRRCRDEPELRVAVDAKRGEVARVDPDDRSIERHCPRQLLRVVRLDERLQTESRAPCRAAREPGRRRDRGGARALRRRLHRGRSASRPHSRRTPSRGAAAPRTREPHGDRPRCRRSARRRGSRPPRRLHARTLRPARPDRRPGEGRPPTASGA